MKKVLLVLMVGIAATITTHSNTVSDSKIKTSKEFVEAVLNHGFKNENCELDNKSLIKSDQKLNNKIHDILNGFGGISIDNFDMGQCLTRDSITDQIFITEFWQKNKQSYGNNLHLYIANNPINNETLVIIVDDDNNKYYLGDKSEFLLAKFSENKETKDSLKNLFFPLGYSFKDLSNRFDIKNERIEAEKKYQQEIKEWNISCRVDRFEGTKICSMNQRYGDIMVAIINGYHNVYVGRDHYPGTLSAVKIDGNKPFYGKEGMIQNPKLVIEQMKRGKVAYTRYKEWPYEYNKDNQSDLSGFTLKWVEMQNRYKKL